MSNLIMKTYLISAATLLLCTSFAAISKPSNALMESLPANVGAYVRIPSLLGLAGAPKGNLPIDKAMATKAHMEALAKIKLAVPNMAVIPNEFKAALDFLLAEQSGPLEIAVLTDSGSLSPISKMMIGMPVANRNAESFQKKWAQLTTKIGMPMPMQFDAKTGLVRIAAGMGATDADLSVLKARQAGNAKLAAANDRIDQSGLGFLVWVDGNAAAPMLAMAASAATPEDAAMYKALQSIDSMAFGWGTQSGFGRMAMDFYLKDNAVWADYLPKTPMNLSLKTAGEPDWVFSFTMPTTADIPNLKRALARDFDVKAVEALQTGLDYPINKALKVADFLAAFGPELVIFGDQTGDFAAMRKQDSRRYEQFLEWVKSSDSNYSYRNGIHKALLSVPQVDSKAAAELGEDEPAVMADVNALAEQMKVLQKLSGSLMFWVEEGDWLVFASTPQALRDRTAVKPSQSIQPWMQKNSGTDGRNALMNLTVLTEKMAMRTWYGYLGALAMISEVSEADVDLHAIPSARELGFPKTGHTGLALEHEQGRLSFALRYQNWPSDALMGQGGVTGVATVAILAAIALPAYQDYTVRAKISSAFIGVSSFKISVQEAYLIEDKLPSAKALDAIEIDGVTLTWTGEHIEVAFTDDFEIAAVRGQTIAFAPVVTDAGISFRCGRSSLPEGKLLVDDPALLTTVLDKYLPSECRARSN
jgi:Tfp pilus assembly major pilin PilA